MSEIEDIHEDEHNLKSCLEELKAIDRYVDNPTRSNLRAIKLYIALDALQWVLDNLPESTISDKDYEQLSRELGDIRDSYDPQGIFRLWLKIKKLICDIIYNTIGLSNRPLSYICERKKSVGVRESIKNIVEKARTDTKTNKAQLDNVSFDK